MKTEDQRVKIAECVGAKWRRFDNCDIIRITFKDNDRMVECERPHEVIFSNTVPDYLNDLNSAVTLCDVLAGEGWTCELGNGLDKTWECTFAREAGLHKIRFAHYHPAHTLAEAICGSFLKVRGLFEEKEETI